MVHHIIITIIILYQGIPALLAVTFFSLRLLILFSFLINLFLLIRLVFGHLARLLSVLKNLQIVCTYQNKTKNNISLQ